MEGRAIILGILAVSILQLCGCAWQTDEPLRQVRVGLSWKHSAQYAGYYTADQNGYYKSQGLNVSFKPYANEDLVAELVNGKYDFVFLQTDNLLQARVKGLPVKAIFADYRILPTVYYSKKEKNIQKPGDFVGKTVGIDPTESYAFLAMLNNAGVNASLVTITKRGYTYDLLANDEYDVQGGWVTDADSVRALCGEFNAISPYDYGANWYADLLVVKEDTIRSQPELIKAFILGTEQGWQYAIEHVHEAALFAQRYEDGLDPTHLEFALQASVPLIQTGDSYIGWMDNTTFALAQGTFLKQGILSSEVDIQQAFTNEFIESIYEK